MSMLKTFVLRIGHYLLSFVRSLRKVLCCKRKKQMEHVLPLTIGDINEINQVQESAFEASEFKTQWETWPSPENNTSIINYKLPRTDSDTDSQAAQTEDDNKEDFFKDMVPQIRKQKKIIVRGSVNDNEPEQSLSNRLTMDPNRIIMSPDLGVIEDNPCNWEDNDSEETWDPDLLIREKKRAEQEKRRAEHQRRKQEKENRKNLKPESLSSRIMSMSETKDKHKYS